MQEIPQSKQQEEKSPSLGPKESANTPVKKQFEVVSNEEEAVNDESRMQDIMESIPKQTIKEIKKVQ